MRVERELQNEKFLPTVGFELGAFPLRSERVATEPRGLMLVELIKVHLVLPAPFLEIYLQHLIDEAK